MSEKAKKIIKFILSVVLAGVLVYFAFRSVDWKAFMEGLRQTRWFYVVLFLLVAFIALVFRLYRWKEMLRPISTGADDRFLWDASNVGNMASVLLPGSGDVFRAVYLSRKKAPFEKVFGTIIMERGWDVLAIAVLFVISLCCKWSRFGVFFNDNILGPFVGKLNFSLWWVVLALAAVIGLFVFLLLKNRSGCGFWAKLYERIRSFGQGFSSFREMKRKWLFLLYTVGIWLMYLLMSYFMLKAMPSLCELTMMDALFLSAVGNIASVIPVPSGMGAYHYLVALTLSSLYGKSWDMGILFATLGHEFHGLLIVVLGIISYFAISFKKTSGK